MGERGKVLVHFRRLFALLLATSAVIALVSGCGQSPAAQTSVPVPSAPLSYSHADHRHGGPHGGALFAIADYYIEIGYDDTMSKLVAYVLASDQSSAKSITPDALAAQIKLDGATAFQALLLTPARQSGDANEPCSRFESPIALNEIKGVFEIDVKIHSANLIYRAHALLDPAAIGPQKYTCPMKCNSGKSYASPGACPTCGMTLVETRSGAIEHTDHTPKHGGVFFMSADNWHHLEGVVIPPDEFRLYLYDNFTRPIFATGIDAVAEISQNNTADPSSPRPVSENLTPGAGGAYLAARIPAASVQPLSLAVHVRFQPGGKAELFNFSFPAMTPQAP